MGIAVKIEAFEGPLDLLLHLIEKNKVNIYDIPIVSITAQYMDYLDQMKQADLDIMSEFLLMAATLIDIKCKMLLPKEITKEGEEIDPRDELVEKLLEYKMYKYMAYELKDRYVDAKQTYFRKKNLPKEVEEYEPPLDLSEFLKDVTIAKLYSTFRMVMKRQNDKIDPIRSKFGKIEKEEISLSDKMDYVSNYIKFHSKFKFRQLLDCQKGRIEIIVTFLSVLELVKKGNIIVVQDSLKDEIEIITITPKEKQKKIEKK